MMVVVMKDSTMIDIFSFNFFILSISKFFLLPFFFDFLSFLHHFSF